MNNGEFELRSTSYFNEAWLEEKMDIKEFMIEVDKGAYPVKCLNCYEMGVRWCHWWRKNFNCGSFEVEKSLNIIKAFFERKKGARKK